jgi:hypothetical protein
LEGISYSEYSGEPVTHNSVYGYVVYFSGAPIALKSNGWKSVTLSSTEAQNYAKSEIAKEVISAKKIQFSLQQIYLMCH